MVFWNAAIIKLLPMRRELFVHFSFWFSFFGFIAIIRHYFALGDWAFWVGGLVGIFLPDVDHLIYVLFVSPQELTSQRFFYLLGRKETWRAIEVLYETRSERKGLIFHTILFQLIFLILTFWMMTSSGSLFGRGLVLSFALHLSVDQLVDLAEFGSFDNWLKISPIKFDLAGARIYWLIVLLLILILGFFV